MATHAERLASLFRGFPDAHGTYSDPVRETKPTGTKWGIHNSARTIRKPPTIELFERHLNGTYPLGIIPITAIGGCYWGGIDVDDYSINPLDIIAKIDNNGYPLIPVLSKSGGLHLFIFLTEEQPATLVQSVLQNLAAKLGLAGSEIFPKQTEVLVERGDVGNWLCIPMLGTTFGGKLSEQAAIKKTGAKLTIEEFLDLAERSRVTPEELKKYDAEDNRKRRIDGKKDSTSNEKSDFEDGPPCLQHLTSQGIPDGGRNNTLFMMGIYYARKNESTWEKELEDANRKYINPPLSSDEVVSVIRSIKKKSPKQEEEGYRYTCKKHPMASHCNSKLCRGRKYGVGTSEEVPKLSGISKLNTEPPIWFINVNDMRVEASTDQLQNYFKFHALCMEKGNVCYRAMKQQDWLTILGDAMQNETTIIEVSSEVSVYGQFKELLDEFLTDRQLAEDKEELVRNLPWKDVESNRVYFRLSALQSYLERQNFKHFNRAKLVQRIRDLGGDNHFFNLKNRGINVWYVPYSSLPPPPGISLPEIKKGPF